MIPMMIPASGPGLVTGGLDVQKEQTLMKAVISNGMRSASYKLK